jgi:hypothetical protein
MPPRSSFAAKRSTNHWGVTGPSQQRYVNYIHRLLSLGEAPTATLFVLSAVELRPVPQFSFGVGRTGCCAVLRVKTDNCTRTLFAGPSTLAEAPCFDAGTSDAVLLNAGNVLVGGDIDVSVKNMRLYREETVLRCGFNVSLEVANAIRAAGGDPAAPPPANITLKFEKCELDDAQGDKRFANDFHLYIHLMAVPAAPPCTPPTDVSMSSLRELASFHDVGSPDDKLLSRRPAAARSALGGGGGARRRRVSPSSSLTLHAESSLYLWRPPAPQTACRAVCASSTRRRCRQGRRRASRGRQRRRHGHGEGRLADEARSRCQELEAPLVRAQRRHAALLQIARPNGGAGLHCAQRHLGCTFCQGRAEWR